MADTLDVRLMTIDEVKANPPLFDKKFILINSSLYTNEAFEYLLDLINETDSIAFIRDLKQIYTHGEYFGGDVWEENLLCFGTFQVLDSNDEFIGELDADNIKDKIRFKSSDNIKLTVDEYFVNNEKLKTITIGYDLNNVVDSTIFTVDDNTAQYNLMVTDGKIGISKYVPIRVEVEDDNIPIEFDNTPENIEFKLNIYGTAENKNIFVTSPSNEIITLSEDKTTVTATIQNNINTKYLVIYSDGIVEDSVTYEKTFAFGLFYSSDEINSANIHEKNKILSVGTCKCEFILNQENNKYGWFACPSIYKPIFKDNDSGLNGGWQKYNDIFVYSNRIKYTIWVTENEGLGEIHWIVN